MVDENKTPNMLLPTEVLKEEIHLKCSCYPDTPMEELEVYVEAVHFIAHWLEIQDGAGGKSTAEQFDQFKENVCTIMAQGAVRT